MITETQVQDLSVMLSSIPKPYSYKLHASGVLHIWFAPWAFPVASLHYFLSVKPPLEGCPDFYVVRVIPVMEDGLVESANCVEESPHLSRVGRSIVQDIKARGVAWL